MYKVSDIMTSDIITVDVKDSLCDAAKVMKEHNIGFIPVVDGEQLAGVVTDRDLVIKGFAENKSPETKIDEVMTGECIAVTPQTTIEDAVNIMSDHKIRRLCVVDEDELIGICAIGDVAVRSKLLDEAGQALSGVSSPTRQQVID